jgi:tRNA (guanine-N7-)-methyltransferase
MIDVDLNQISIPITWQELFARSAPTDVEIGSGKGAFLNEYAIGHPERNILAVERSAKYHRLCCERAARRGIENLRLIRTTGEDLLYRLLAPDTVATIFVLFSDPWPKKRHHKRRFFTPENVTAMHRALVSGGRLLVKSDHEAYAEVIAEVLGQARGFAVLDSENAFAGLPLSGFERKYLVDGRTIHSFALEKQSS